MLNKKTFWQLFRFGIIGVLAAVVNFVVVVLIVENFLWNPLLANLIAFLIAFNVSYFGHRFWTFNHRKHATNSLTKFFMVSTLSLLLNESMFAILLQATTLHYTTALIITILMVAMITFVISKFWAFK